MALDVSLKSAAKAKLRERTLKRRSLSGEDGPA